MNKPQPQERSRPPRTKRKSCFVGRTDKFIAIVSDEIWAGMYFSRHGLAIHASREVTPEWIGAHVRQALETSEYCAPPLGVSIDHDQLVTMKGASTERRLAFWDEIASTYGYKDREAAWKKRDQLFISWFYETEPDIIIRASKSSRSGSHSAWPRGMNEGRVFHVPFAASDKEIGETVLNALAKCEGPGKSTQPVFP